MQDDDDDDGCCSGDEWLESKQDNLMRKNRGLIEIDPNFNVLKSTTLSWIKKDVRQTLQNLEMIYHPGEMVTIFTFKMIEREAVLYQKGCFLHIV